ncbi:MAG: bacillithiol biosynthesis deacetylase BshB2 [Bacillaceae bacterium]
MNQHVLVIFPHPDDEAFGVSGTIAEFTSKGIPVTYACLTLGEMGRNMGKPAFVTRESLPVIRKEELQEACRVLGIKDLRMLGYRDKTIEFEDETKLAHHMLSIIQDVQPSLIITFYPGYSVHPDHDATGAAVIKAVSFMPKEERPVVHTVAFAKNTLQDLGKPDIIKDISPYTDIKLAAIKAHRSQTENMLDEIEEKLHNENSKLKSWWSKEQFWIYRF